MTDPIQPAAVRAPSGLIRSPRRAAAAALALLLALPLIAAPQVAAQLATFQHPGVPRFLETDGEAGRQDKKLSLARRHMIAAANPHAVDAGLAILRAGGSAVDAAIAAQIVLNLVEPQSSGIGGGAFLLHWDERARKLQSYDGRETAPAGVSPAVFLGPDGKPRGFWEVVTSGDSVGVPGLVQLMALAHRRHGRLAWAKLFEPAIALAEKGFPVSHRLNALLATRGPEHFDATARAYFFDNAGKPIAIGTMLTNPALAGTFRQIARRGPAAFYKGTIASAIEAAVAAAPNRGGKLTSADIAAYAARERTPVCTLYRAYRVCGMGPPSSGGLATAMTLQLLARHDLSAIAPLAPRAVHLIVEAQKLAYADRDRWVADPDRVAVPAAGLLDPVYIASRAALIDSARASGRAEAGTPPGAPQRAGTDATNEVPGTTHLSVVDARGNAVALTSSIEAGFGSGLMAAGFLLNNQLTDFSFRTHDAQGRAIANAPAPGKRPRSSMAPTMIFDPRGRLVAVLGSPGGSRIPLFVVKSVVGLIDWKLDAQAAADLANFGSRNGPLELEAKAAGPDLEAALKQLGHEIVRPSMTSGTHIITRRPNGTLEGGADPRREGIARGD